GKLISARRSPCGGSPDSSPFAFSQQASMVRRALEAAAGAGRVALACVTSMNSHCQSVLQRIEARLNSIERLASLMAVVAPLVCCWGCGSSAETTRVTGKVTIAGKEIPADAEAFVIFDPQDEANEAESETVPVINSRYESSNVPIGKNKVYFDISRKTGPP